MHVCIAEIENYARQTIAEHLRSLGHLTSLCSAPEALLETLNSAQEPVDLIIADLAPGQQ
tara:strand:+ start:660 stop:839 length:180 start_codon:yes stop_codon:yes gene_type:complete